MTIKPRIWIFENVRGMAHRNKQYLNKIIVSNKVVHAKRLDVPQNLERLIVVGHKNEFFFPEYSDTSFIASDTIKDIAFKLTSDDVFLTKSQDEYIKNMK